MSDAAAEQDPPEEGPLVEGQDFYMDGEYMVFTAAYHRKRGRCCGSRCRHCPYDVEAAQRA